MTSLVVAVDPDSSSSAVAWATRTESGGFAFAGVEGGGSRAVTWQTITGARAWLSERRWGVAESPDVAVVVELQAASGPQSADCEALRRVRYHWQAACEVDGYACTFVSVGTWEHAFVPKDEHPGRGAGAGAGAWKKAYQRHAKSLTPLATNEDRCAAIGMLWWYVVDVLGSTLDFPGRSAIDSARK